MYIKTEGIAQVRHKDTREVFKIASDELNWQVVSIDERNMGSARIWEAETSRDELGSIQWEIFEYPEGSFGEFESNLNGHELVQDFSFSIEYESDDLGDDLADDLEPFDRTEAADKMKQWFHGNYEDPANSLPYISKEGGYQWIRGGPDTPHEVLQDHYGSEFPWEFINEVADAIVTENELNDWTPILDLDFYSDNEDPNAEAVFEDEAALLNRRMPLAEELVQNPDSGAFNVRYKEIAKPDLLSATLRQVADAVEDVLVNQSNGLNANSLDIRKLRRTLERYANDPQRIEMDLTTVYRSLTVQIAKDELPPSDENNALISALQQGAQGIRATDPVVAENREILKQQALRELPPEALNQIAKAAPVLEAITEGDLQEQIREDILYLTKDMRAGQPSLPDVTRADGSIRGRDETVRVFGRSARMLIQLRKAPEWINKLHDSAGFKAISILAVLISLVSLALSLLE